MKIKPYKKDFDYMKSQLGLTLDEVTDDDTDEVTVLYSVTETDVSCMLSEVLLSVLQAYKLSENKNTTAVRVICFI